LAKEIMKTNNSKTMKIKHLLLTIAVLCGLFTAVDNSFAQGTAFTYQGLLGNSNNLVTGSYDFTFKLFNAASGPSQVGPTVTVTALGVTNGLFITSMDFGAQFNGTPYWLEIGVRTNGGGGFTTLTPRQALTPTPYAITSENLDGFLSASQLTGTLPAGVLTGVSGGGLTSLNASQLTSGTVPDARLSPNVALLNANQTFLKTNTFDSSSTGGRFILQGNGIDTNLFTGFSLQYDSGNGEGALIPSFNDGVAELGFYSKAGFGQPIARTMLLDWYGGLRLDQGNSNNGVLNNGTPAGAGLTFGTGSGEGIASKRTVGGDQYGLDFYTSFNNRMSILNSGFVGIGRQSPVTGADLFSVTSPTSPGNYGGMYLDTTSSNALPFYGYAINGSAIAWTTLDGSDGNKWKLYNGGFQLTVTPSGFVGIGTTSPTAQLHVVKGGASGQSDGFGGGPAIFADTSTSDGIYSSTSAGVGYGVWGVASGSSGVGVYGQATTNTAVGVTAQGSGSSNSVALSITGGNIRVQGAGNNTSTPAFIHITTVASVSANYSVIHNPMCDGDPSAILLVTPNLNPQGVLALYNNHPIGVWYNGSNWTIFEQDSVAMPVGEAFNVLIIKR
jgi:hypothetical protein